MILVLQSLLFFHFFFKICQLSDFWCDYLYMIHNICKYFEFVSVHIQK